MGISLPPVVGDVLRVAAPVLAGALAGPLAPLAATIAAGALDAWLGPAAKSAGTVAPTAIVQVVQENAGKPDFIEAVRKAEADLKEYEISSGLRFAELEQKDRADARAMNASTGLARPMFFVGMGIVAISMLMLFGVVLLAVLAMNGTVRIDPAQAGIAPVAFNVIGSVTTGLLSLAMVVMAFYFGSSAGSADKTAQIGDTMRDMGQALSDAAKSAPSRPAPAPAPVVVVPAQPTPAQPGPVGPSRFIGLVEKLLDHEGGWVDNPNDPGGCTNLGITLPTLRDWRHDASLTCEDVRALTKETAREIYYARYWNALCCNDLPAGLDYCVFDFGVNAGIGRSAKTLQKILAKRDPSLKVDGVIGPMTLAALSKASPRALIEEFHAARMDFYRSLGTWPHFGKGWTRRAEAVFADALAAANTAA